LTSGHVGSTVQMELGAEDATTKDVSSEKLDWLYGEILDGELANESALLVWTRWRRERERLQKMLADKINIYQIFGGQAAESRRVDIQSFQSSNKRRIMIAQIHAGAFGLDLSSASTAVFLSNDFS